MGHVTANVGGVYETFKVAEQNEAVYEVTPKARQKEAVAFLNKQIFETPNWLIDRELWNKFNNPVSNDPIMSAQDGVLGSLISPTRLGRLQLASNRFGVDKAYNAMELLNDVQTGLFSELSSKKPLINTVDYYK